MKKIKISFAFILVFAMLLSIASPGLAEALIYVREAVVCQDVLYFITDNGGYIWKMEQPGAWPEQVLDMKEFDDLLDNPYEPTSVELCADEESVYLLDWAYQTLWEIQDGTLTEKVKLDFSGLGFFPDSHDESRYFTDLRGDEIIIDGYLYTIVCEYPDYTQFSLYRFSLENGTREKIEAIPNEQEIILLYPYQEKQILVTATSGITFIYDTIQNTAVPFIKYSSDYSGLTYNQKTDKLYYFNDDSLMEYKQHAKDITICSVARALGRSKGFTTMWQDHILALYSGHLYIFETERNNYFH